MSVFNHHPFTILKVQPFEYMVSHPNFNQFNHLDGVDPIKGEPFSIAYYFYQETGEAMWNARWLFNNTDLTKLAKFFVQRYPLTLVRYMEFYEDERLPHTMILSLGTNILCKLQHFVPNPEGSHKWRAHFFYTSENHQTVGTLIKDILESCAFTTNIET